MAKLVNNLAKPNSVLTKASLDKFRVVSINIFFTFKV